MTYCHSVNSIRCYFLFNVRWENFVSLYSKVEIQSWKRLDCMEWRKHAMPYNNVVNIEMKISFTEPEHNACESSALYITMLKLKLNKDYEVKYQLSHPYWLYSIGLLKQMYNNTAGQWPWHTNNNSLQFVHLICVKLNVCFICWGPDYNQKCPQNKTRSKTVHSTGQAERLKGKY